MRPHGRDALASLYFEYPIFDAPQHVPATQHAPVVIVGAGPIGMISALTLAKYGVHSILLDNKATFNDGSRAICISRSSYQILDALGVVSDFCDHALPWDTGYSYYRGKKILEFQMPDSANEKFRPMYNLQQQYIEQFLYQCVEKNPFIEMRWRSELMQINKDTDTVHLDIKDPLRSYIIACDWVVAADGARSTTRRLCGHRLNGENYEGRYVIADVQMDHDFPTIRRALFDPKSRPGGTVLIHKQPHNIWRIDYQLGPEENVQDAIAETSVRQSVAAVLADIGYAGTWDLEWWSIYSANTLLLDDYRDGRIFFAGDSAHIVPIFGVRGLNNGIADGFNIGWKLAYFLTGKADKDILDSYTPERRGATLDVFANATKSTRFMTPPTQGWQVMRDAALSLALTDTRFGKLANPRQMTPYTYAQSPLTHKDDATFTAGPKSGAVFLDAPYADGYLCDALSGSYSLIYFGQTPPDDQDWCNVLKADPHSTLGDLYDAQNGTAYLIRPDLHIAGRWKHFDKTRFDASLAKAALR